MSAFHTRAFRRPLVEEIVSVHTDTGWRHIVLIPERPAADPSLIAKVHQEWRAGFAITATITSQGGLYVEVAAPARSRVWDGDNIIDARRWVDARR